MPLSTLHGLASVRRASSAPLAFGALLLASLARPSTLPAQPAAPAFDLSVANIMRGPEHYGWEPQQVRWTADGQWLYFRWVAAGSAWDTPMSWYRVRPAAGATPERVDDAHADSIAPYIASGPVTRDGRTRAVSANGDLWLIDARRGSARRLTETVAGEADPRFSADERHLLFLREGNAYALELATGATRQLTDVRAGPAPRDSARATGQRGALVQDQLDLLQVIRDRARSDSTARAARDAATARRLPVLYAPAGERIAAVSVSPNLQVAVMLTTAAGTGARTADVPNYVTSSGYSEMIPTRSKVGDAQSHTRAWRVDLATGALTALPVIGTDTTQRAASVQVAGWRDDGSMALLFTTSLDFKSRYVVSVPTTGAAMVTDALRDSAWVNGPCFGCAGWLPDGRAWYVSEASGYAHLYASSPDGSGKVALTSGAWEVLQVDLSPDRRWFWLHTSETSPFVREFWRLPVTGGARERLTAETGGHTVVVSPDGRRAADVYSSSNTPPELFVQAFNGSGRVQLTTSTTDAFRSARWLAPPIVHIPASDGVGVPARLYTPESIGATRNGAAVIFVHGAGYLHNVHEYWSSYAREYLFHHLLVSKGYVVLDIDYRASAGYGRDWRTAIYRHMGGRDHQDHVDGSRWLQREHGIAAERIGIYGGSYGGFITLMALFTAPKDFGAGAALRAVTDWAHYNHGYTGRILNQPQDDTTSYRRSSPIFFAEGLEDPLLIAHGMVDTNVHFQDVVRLAQRLIELGKTEWEMAVYPVEDHGFVRPDSWTDEYRRILELFERTIGPNGSKAPRR
jgi:dipeptidyl aminopeptidase/acylaminoacyl peptidase